MIPPNLQRSLAHVNTLRPVDSDTDMLQTRPVVVSWSIQGRRTLILAKDECPVNIVCTLGLLDTYAAKDDFIILTFEIWLD